MSAAYERAAGLSPGPAAKGQRLALAAEAAVDAGQLPRAADLAWQADGLAADPAAAAALARVRAVLQFEAAGPADAAGILLDGAALLGSADPVTAQEMVFQAVNVLSLIAGPAHVELERRAAAMLSPEGRNFWGSSRRCGDCRTAIPKRRSLCRDTGAPSVPVSSRPSTCTSTSSRAMRGRPELCRRPGRRVP